MAVKRVGLLTGGGDCPGLNAVIRGVTKCLIRTHGIEVVGIRDGYRGLIERDVVPLDYGTVSGILTRGGTILGSSNKANPFQYYGQNKADVSDAVLDYCRELGLECLVAIGGDGTLSIAHDLSCKGLPCVGVPKTIDNDLMGTDRTFGFDTAVAVATDAIDRLHTTAQSHQRVIVLETMGRNAGWIALHAGTAGGADVILLPEYPFQLEQILEVCRQRENDNRKFTIIAVAEGARPQGGDLTVAAFDKDKTDPVRLGGIARVLEQQLGDQLDSEVRATILGHVQRGGSPTPFDRVLATSFGAEAARLVAAEQFGFMVALQGRAMKSVPLEIVANQQRKVRADDVVVQAALAVGTSFGVTELHDPE